MRVWARIVFLLTVFGGVVLRAEPALGQDGATGTGAVAGTVVDSTSRAPIERAAVQAIQRDGAPSASTITDAAGRFRFAALPAGTYRFRVRRIGYGVVESSPIALAAGTTRTVEFAMQRQPTMLDSFVVQGKRIADAVVKPTQQIIVGRLMDDATDEPLSGGTIELRDVHDKVVDSQITDDAGRFNFATPAPGTYSMSGERQGFQSAVQHDLRFRLGDTLVVEFRVSRANALIAPMIVTASARPMTGRRERVGFTDELYDRMRKFGSGKYAATYVTRDSIEDFEARGFTTQELVERFTLDRDKYHTIRGCTGNTAFVDGRPSYPTVDLPLKTLELIEIYTRPAIPRELVTGAFTQAADVLPPDGRPALLSTPCWAIVYWVRR